MCIYTIISNNDNNISLTFRKKRKWSKRNKTLARYDYEATTNNRTMASIKTGIKVQIYLIFVYYI